MKPWNENLCGQIKTALKQNKKVEVILAENASFNARRSKNVVSDVRTTKFPDELEVRLDNSKTYTPINEFDIVLIGK